MPSLVEHDVGRACPRKKPWLLSAKRFEPLIVALEMRPLVICCQPTRTCALASRLVVFSLQSLLLSTARPCTLHEFHPLMDADTSGHDASFNAVNLMLSELAPCIILSSDVSAPLEACQALPRLVDVMDRYALTGEHCARMACVCARVCVCM